MGGAHLDADRSLCANLARQHLAASLGPRVAPRHALLAEIRSGWIKPTNHAAVPRKG